jgi:CRP-like cAMP-binding protein
MNAPSILERKVIHAGKTFIRAGQEHGRAYVVQNGLVRAYVMDGEEKVVVAEYEPGRIICENCLMVDEPVAMNFEAVTDTTVITVTRDEFRKRISRMDKDIMSILEHVMNKLNYMDMSAIEKAREHAEIDEDAYKMLQALTHGVPEDKKHRYEKAMLPHVNGLIKAIKDVKSDLE